MKSTKRITYLLALLLIVLSSCSEEEKEITGKNLNPPGQISNVHVTNLPGAARIQYQLPSDQDLLYVKAVYTLSSGRVMEVKSSYYNNSLEVEGFADTIEYTVDLYAVNRSEVASEVVGVTIKPLENPIWETFRTLEAIPAFGGIKVMAENPAQKDLTIMVMIDSLGEWVPSVDNIYTSIRQIDRNIRGLDTIAQTFAITIRDQYMNFTDTLITTLTPLYEATLPKSGYRAIVLPTDSPQEYASTALSYMWDGEDFHWPNISMTRTGDLTPQWVTFDTGILAKMSRIVIWGYAEYTNSGRIYYRDGNMRNFEIWGSDNPPSDGSWNNWVKLGEFEEVKPSGLPMGQQSDEDYEIARNGVSYDFDVTAPRVRYLRIRCNRNWGGTTYMAIAEVQVYGDAR